MSAQRLVRLRHDTGISSSIKLIQNYILETIGSSNHSKSAKGPKNRLSDQHANSRAQGTRRSAALQACRIFERHGAHGRGIEVLPHLRNERAVEVPGGDRDGLFDRWQRGRGAGVVTFVGFTCQ